MHVTGLNEVYLSKHECEEEVRRGSKIIYRNELSKPAYTHTLSLSVLYANAEPAVLRITVWNDKTKQDGITNACFAIG